MDTRETRRSQAGFEQGSKRMANPFMFAGLPISLDLIKNRTEIEEAYGRMSKGSVEDEKRKKTFLSHALFLFDLYGVSPSSALKAEHLIGRYGEFASQIEEAVRKLRENKNSGSK